MKAGRILIVLALLALLAVAALLLMRPNPTLVPELPAPKKSAPPPAEPADLGRVLALDRLADCSLSPALGAVLEQMVRIDQQTFESRRGGPITVAGFDRPLIPTFERTREIADGADTRAVTAELDLPGRWHGLAVAGLRRSFYEESDASAFDIRFMEPPERVRETLIRHGFILPPVDETRAVDADEPGITTEIGVGRLNGGATLTCATG